MFMPWVGDLAGVVAGAGCDLATKGKNPVTCAVTGVTVQEAVKSIPAVDLTNGPTNAWLSAKTGEPLNYPNPRG